MEQKTVPTLPQYVFIHPDLLSDQIKTIQIMEKVQIERNTLEKDVKKFFDQVDVQNIGVITHPQFLGILNSLGIKLKEEEKNDVLKRVDKD